MSALFWILMQMSVAELIVLKMNGRCRSQCSNASSDKQLTESAVLSVSDRGVVRRAAAERAGGVHWAVGPPARAGSPAERRDGHCFQCCWRRGPTLALRR